MIAHKTGHEGVISLHRHECECALNICGYTYCGARPIDIRTYHGFTITIEHHAAYLRVGMYSIKEYKTNKKQYLISHNSLLNRFVHSKIECKGTAFF